MLQHHAEAFKAHTRIYVFFGKLLQGAVCFPVELDEYVVPDLDYPGVVLVDQGVAGHLGAFGIAAQVHVDFGAWAAGTGIAHFPEVVFLVAIEDVVFRQEAQPDGARFVVGGQVVFFVPFKNRGVEAVFGQAIHLRQQFPGPAQRFVLEVIADGPVAQHFEHRVVRTVVAHVFQVVVFARHAQAFLGIGDAAVIGHLVAEEEVLELVHPGVGEHEGRIIFVHNRCR